MNQKTKCRIIKEVALFSKRNFCSPQLSTKLLRFVLSQTKKGQKEIITDAIKIFEDVEPKDTIFTKNPILLELKGVRGDYE
ncbi:MAG: hypothetical protein ACREHC_06755 [Candidatus Levyibacteriota bacterium]